MMETARRFRSLISARLPRTLSAAALISLVMAIVFGAGDSFKIWFIRYLGYYCTASAFAGLLYYAWKICPRDRWTWPSPTLCLFGGLSVALGLWINFIHSDPGFKVAMDEYVLASTARSLHENREVFTVTRIFAEGNCFRPSEGYVDKRPWVYPFLVAILHDLRGYRLRHSFDVNTLLAAGFLTLSFISSYRMFGLWAGALSVLLWSTLPLLMLSAGGGGMELLGLVLLVLLIYACGRYLLKPSADGEALISFCVLFLAYARYELICFSIPALIVICIGWHQAKRIYLSAGSLIALSLLLPLLFQIQFSLASADAWKLSGDFNTAFALEHVGINLGHALAFFFSYDWSLANSLFLSVFGFIALVGLPFIVRRHWSRYRHSGSCLSGLIFLPFFGLHLLVILGFHASRLDSPFVSRYSLIFHLFLVMAVLFLVDHLATMRKTAWKYAVATCLIYICAITMPKNAVSNFSERNFAIKEQAWLVGLSEHKFQERSLVVDRFTVPWSLRDWVAIPPHLALENASVIVNEVSSGRYPAIYLVERLEYRGEGEFTPTDPVFQEIAKAFAMDLIDEKSFRPFTLTRVHQIRTYRGVAGGSF
jgi:hypothetical protein